MDAGKWDERYAGQELVWSAEPNRFVVEVVDGWPPGRALDVACGEGRNAIWLARQGWDVAAVDFSSVAIDRGRRLADEAGVQVTWECADVTTHPLGDAEYDLVLLAYLQLPDDLLGPVLRRAAAAAASGGAVVVVAHARDNLAHGVGGPQDPSVLPTPDEVVAHLGDLTVERAEHVRRRVDTPDGVRDA
ncbi:MAG: class I SAM-dependent methyltransferase, partial [Ilumatobacteraceae bacterium]